MPGEVGGTRGVLGLIAFPLGCRVCVGLGPVELSCDPTPPTAPGLCWLRALGSAGAPSQSHRAVPVPPAHPSPVEQHLPRLMQCPAQPRSAQAGSGKGFGCHVGPVHLGTPLQLSFCREMQEGVGKEGGKGHLKWLLSANRSHPARPPSCQSGRKSNSGPRPESTEPLVGHSSGFGGHFPRDWVPLVPSGRRKTG